jgi:hypothetical protein
MPSKCVHVDDAGKRCNTRPYFNTLGEIVGLYCTKHKLDGMIDVRNKRCQFDGCFFNLPH